MNSRHRESQQILNEHKSDFHGDKLLPKGRILTHIEVPILSVIMPVHNSEKTVVRAVKSTLRAMPSNSELLIQLDGCTDNSRKEIESVADNRISVFESADNIGVSATLNSLLLRASGTYIARMDADDVCLRGRFTKQLRSVRSLNSDLLFGKAILWNPTSFIPFIPSPTPKLSRRELDLALVRSNPFVHPTLLAKKSCLESLGGYRESAAEDYDLWLRARTEGYQIDRINSYVLLYRVHESQITRNSIWQQKLNNDQNLASSLRKFAEQVLGLHSEAHITLAETSDALWNNVVAKFKPPVVLRWKLLGVKATLRSLRKKP